MNQLREISRIGWVGKFRRKKLKNYMIYAKYVIELSRYFY